MFKPIEWSEEFEPNDNCRYNHVVGKTPLGNFLISWKGWKDSPMFDIEELPFLSELNSGFICLSDNSLDAAKEQCEKLYQEKLSLTLAN